jgi:hypothetical protein
MEPTGAVLPDGGIITDLATKAMHSLLKSEFMGSSRSLGVAAYMLLYWKMGMSWTTP